MKTKMTLINIVFLLSMAGICQAQETKKGKLEADANAMPIIKYLWYGFDLLDIRRGIEGKISVDVATTVKSKHIWHGIDLLDDRGVVQPSVGVTLGDTGFSGRVIGSYCLSKDFFSKSQSLIYAVFYTGAFLKDKPYATNYTTKYIYYNKPRIGGGRSDSQEAGIFFYWPKLLGDSKLVPNYYFGTLWPTRGNGNLRGCEGFIHTFGLTYDLNAPDFWGAGKNQTFRLSGDITYNDGFGVGANHDWSHAALGVSTDLKKGNFTIKPFLNYQISMDDSVNPEDELWCGVNATYRF